MGSSTTPEEQFRALISQLRSVPEIYKRGVRGNPNDGKRISEEEALRNACAQLTTYRAGLREILGSIKEERNPNFYSRVAREEDSASRLLGIYRKQRKALKS